MTWFRYGAKTSIMLRVLFIEGFAVVREKSAIVIAVRDSKVATVSHLVFTKCTHYGTFDHEMASPWYENHHYAGSGVYRRFQDRSLKKVP